jgi:hypothetical protein
MSENLEEEVIVPTDIASDREKMAALRLLMQSEGWEILRDYCLDQEKARVAAIMSSPVGDQTQVYAQEYSKAEAWTYHTLAELPKMLIDTMQDNIDLNLSKRAEAGEDVSKFREDGDEEEGTPSAAPDLNCP